MGGPSSWLLRLKGLVGPLAISAEAEAGPRRWEEEEPECFGNEVLGLRVYSGRQARKAGSGYIFPGAYPALQDHGPQTTPWCDSVIGCDPEVWVKPSSALPSVNLFGRPWRTMDPLGMWLSPSLFLSH